MKRLVLTFLSAIILIYFTGCTNLPTKSVLPIQQSKMALDQNTNADTETEKNDAPIPEIQPVETDDNFNADAAERNKDSIQTDDDNQAKNQSFVGQADEEKFVVFSNGGLNFSIPKEYIDLLVVETPENSDQNILLAVYEKASIELAKAKGQYWDGAGFLFSIGTVSEETYHNMICHGMSGSQAIAKDDKDVYYIYRQPTGATMFRENYKFTEDDTRIWSELSDIGKSLKKTFPAENGLTTVNKTNSTLDIYLARLMYGNDVNYTVNAEQYGLLNPNGVNVSDFIDPLVNGMVVTEITNEEDLGSEYVSLILPDDNYRFDFFTSEGKENYIRQISTNTNGEIIYKADFADESIKASKIMQDLYSAIALANSNDNNSDAFVGTWVEKISKRGGIEIQKGDGNGIYHVSIHWAGSAFESNDWTMTAKATGIGSNLRYDDAKYVKKDYSSGTEPIITVMYENGTGSFILLNSNELIWSDETGHAADNNVFIRTGS